MGRKKKLVETRDISNVSTPQAWLMDLMAGRPSDSGITVSADNARASSAYYAGVRNLSVDMGAMYPQVMKKTKDGAEEAPFHPVQLLLDSPNDEMTRQTQTETLFQHAISIGNGYNLIQRDNAGNPIALHPLDPSATKVYRRIDTGELYYTSVYLFKPVVLYPDDLIHIKSMGWLGLEGWGVVSLAKEAIGRCLSSQKFANKFFANGCAPAGILEFPARMAADKMEQIGKDFKKNYGGADNAGKNIGLPDGVKWVQITVDPTDSQLIEVMNFSTTDVLRFFRLSPVMAGDLTHASYNSENESINHVKYSLGEWVRKYEQELTKKLFPKGSPYFIRLNHDDLARGDSAAQSDYATKMISNGTFTINEMRKYLGKPPVEGGDANYRPANLVDITQPVAQTPAATPQDSIDKAQQNPQAQPAPEQLTRAWLNSTLERLLNVEKDKIQRRSLNSAEHYHAIMDYFRPIVLNAATGDCEEVLNRIAKRHLSKLEHFERLNAKDLTEEYLKLITGEN